MGVEEPGTTESVLMSLKAEENQMSDGAGCWKPWFLVCSCTCGCNLRFDGLDRYLK